MELITSDQRNQLFDTLQRSAFHLELRDQYGVPGEVGPFTIWQQGGCDDLAWVQGWLTRMREVTGNGGTVRRVRVITEPVTDYIRWEHHLTPLTLEAGEDIRWLPRHQLPDDVAFPRQGSDWWLFDDRLLAVGVVGHDGGVLGSEIVTDPAAVAECVAVRDRLWPLAIPHDEYKLT